MVREHEPARVGRNGSRRFRQASAPAWTGIDGHTRCRGGSETRVRDPPVRRQVPNLLKPDPSSPRRSFRALRSTRALRDPLPSTSNRTQQHTFAGAHAQYDSNVPLAPTLPEVENLRGVLPTVFAPSSAVGYNASNGPRSYTKGQRGKEG